MSADRSLRAIGLMLVSMAAFAVTDMFMKLATATLPVQQVILVTSAGGATVFGLLAKAGGQRLISPHLLARGVMMRNAAEVVGTICIVSALAAAPLALVTVINQSSPLLVTVGAALFLGERVGPWRWGAVVVGFAGVMLIVRPAGDGLSAGVLYALGAAVGFSARDLATRALPAGATTLQVSTWGLGVLVPVSALLLAVTGGAAWPDAREWAVLAGTVVALAVAYYTITASVRLADVSLVIPYRYTRILFALVIAYLVFGERIDAATLAGAAIVVGSGLFVLMRERRAAG